MGLDTGGACSSSFGTFSSIIVELLAFPLVVARPVAAVLFATSKDASDAVRLTERRRVRLRRLEDEAAGNSFSAEASFWSSVAGRGGVGGAGVAVGVTLGDGALSSSSGSFDSAAALLLGRFA